MEKVYNKSQAAKMLKISRTQLDLMIKDGRITGERYATFTVIPQSQIDKWEPVPDKHNHKLKLK